MKYKVYLTGLIVSIALSGCAFEAKFRFTNEESNKVVLPPPPPIQVVRQTAPNYSQPIQTVVPVPIPPPADVTTRSEVATTSITNKPEAATDGAIKAARHYLDDAKSRGVVCKPFEFEVPSNLPAVPKFDLDSNDPNEEERAKVMVLEHTIAVRGLYNNVRNNLKERYIEYLRGCLNLN